MTIDINWLEIRSNSTFYLFYLRCTSFWHRHRITTHFWPLTVSVISELRVCVDREIRRRQSGLSQPIVFYEHTHAPAMYRSQLGPLPLSHLTTNLLSRRLPLLLVTYVVNITTCHHQRHRRWSRKLQLSDKRCKFSTGLRQKMADFWQRRFWALRILTLSLNLAKLGF